MSHLCIFLSPQDISMKKYRNALHTRLFVNPLWHPLSGNTLFGPKKKHFKLIQHWKNGFVHKSMGDIFVPTMRFIRKHKKMTSYKSVKKCFIILRWLPIVYTLYYCNFLFNTSITFFTTVAKVLVPKVATDTLPKIYQPIVCPTKK